MDRNVALSLSSGSGSITLPDLAETQLRLTLRSEVVLDGLLARAHCVHTRHSELVLYPLLQARDLLSQ